MVSKCWQRSLTGFVLGFISIAGVAQAGIVGSNSSQDSVTASPAAASAKPYSPVNTTAQGNCVTASTTCPDTPCASGHLCGCISFTNFPMKLPSSGAVKVSAELSYDVNEVTDTGLSVCFGAYGAGTATISSGDKININYNGQLCGSGTGIDSTSGTWLVTGGTGTLANARGTGLYSISHSDLFGTSACVETMDGTYRAKP